MQRCVFLTRSFEDSLKLAKALHGRGVPSLIESLFRVYYRDPHEEWPRQVDGIIFTSRHGVDGLVRCYPHIHRRTKVYAVGVSTASQAGVHGFQNIQTASGDARSLLQMFNASDGSFVYARGHDIHMDLREVLMQRGLRVWDPVVYETQMASELTPHLQSKIQEKKIGITLCFSDRTLETLTYCVEKHRLEDFKSFSILLCASDRLCEKALQRGWKKAEAVDPKNFEGLVSVISRLGLAERESRL